SGGASHVAEFHPLAVRAARLDRGRDELHALDAVVESRQYVAIRLAVAADDLGELVVERRKGFEIALGMPTRDPDVHGRGDVTRDGAASRQELLGFAELGEPHVIRVVLPPFKAAPLSVNA